MNISLNWLKEFVSLSNISPEEIKEKLTAHTVEVEDIIDLKKQFQNIIIAKILEIKKHPKADKLQLVLVDAGEKEALNIVCGASNIEVGQLVPLAKIGAILPNNLEIKEAEIRGEKSFGMLCAEDELGLGNDHSGIMILNENAQVGQNFSEYLGLNEIVLEIDNKSISNRPDLWNHYGIARELSVIFNKKLKEYEYQEIKISKNKDDEPKNKLSAEIKIKNLCKKYFALKIENIKIQESPEWIKNKLKAIGIKPINNIVDIGNYVMFELGQPIHIFDAENINKIIIKKAEKNEKIIGLDDQEKILNDDDIVISSEKEIIAIAGVIGSKNSQVSNTTNSIIIESANFDAVSVRKTAQRLNSRTDAAMRFEKGLDPELCQVALKRVVELIKKDNSKILIKESPVEDGDYKSGEIKKIDISISYLEKIIGQKIENKKIKEILQNLGMKIEEVNEDKWTIIIPSWRKKDLEIKEDIVEEIIRIYGYNNIEAIVPMDRILPPEKNEEIEIIRKIKKILSLSYKMIEIYNYSFVNEDQLNKLNIDSTKHLRLLNPLSSQHTLLRQSLLPNLVANIKSNQAKLDDLLFFEIANVFSNITGDLPKNDKKNENLPHQEKKLGIILAKQKEDSFSLLKDLISNALSEMSNKSELDFLPTEIILEWSEEREKCLLSLNNKEIGFLAKINKNIALKNGIKRDFSYLEINIKKLIKAILLKGEYQYEVLSKFPPINRDLAFVIDQKILYNDIRDEIKNFNNLIKQVELFDVYSGDNLDLNKKSMAFHISYQSEEGTLTGEEVDSIQKELIKYFEEKFSAQIRNF